MGAAVALEAARLNIAARMTPRDCLTRYDTISPRNADTNDITISNFNASRKQTLLKKHLAYTLIVSGAEL
jgi:hypothetical protein